jgi:uncharacterized protein
MPARGDSNDLDLQFAKTGREMHGKLPVERMPRLASMLSAPTGSVEFNAVGHVRKDGRPAITLGVWAVVPVTCQRCLGTIEHAVASQRELVFVEASALGDISDEEPDADYIDMRERLPLASMIEDEVLLSLPMVARHPGLECQVVRAASGIPCVDG